LFYWQWLHHDTPDGDVVAGVPAKSIKEKVNTVPVKLFLMAEQQKKQRQQQVTNVENNNVRSGFLPYENVNSKFDFTIQYPINWQRAGPANYSDIISTVTFCAPPSSPTKKISAPISGL
jgi:hypothetical protein